MLIIPESSMPTKKGIKARMNGLVNFSGNNPQKEKVQQPEFNTTLDSSNHLMLLFTWRVIKSAIERNCKL